MRKYNRGRKGKKRKGKNRTSEKNKQNRISGVKFRE